MKRLIPILLAAALWPLSAEAAPIPDAEREALANQAAVLLLGAADQTPVPMAKTKCEKCKCQQCHCKGRKHRYSVTMADDTPEVFKRWKWKKRRKWKNKHKCKKFKCHACKCKKCFDTGKTKCKKCKCKKCKWKGSKYKCKRCKCGGC